MLKERVDIDVDIDVSVGVEIGMGANVVAATTIENKLKCDYFFFT